MLCEICGREFRGKGFKITVEGAELTVCPNCKKFGTSPFTKKRIPKTEAGEAGRPSYRTPHTRPSQKSKERSLELVEDYNVLVKNKRESMKLSQGDLGKKINEKESLIHRIETKHIRPSTKVARKLEKALGVTLLESVGDVAYEKKQSLSQGLTIGDIIKFKK